MAGCHRKHETKVKLRRLHLPPVPAASLRSDQFGSEALYLIHAGMCGAELFPAWRGEDENPRGGAKKCVNRLIQKFDKSAQIVMEIFVVYYDVLINENIISSHF